MKYQKMSLWQLMGEIERERVGPIIYIHTIIFKNPLFGTSGILTLEREIERERNKINYN